MRAQGVVSAVSTKGHQLHAAATSLAAGNTCTRKGSFQRPAQKDTSCNQLGCRRHMPAEGVVPVVSTEGHQLHPAATSLATGLPPRLLGAA